MARPKPAVAPVTRITAIVFFLLRLQGHAQDAPVQTGDAVYGCRKGAPLQNHRQWPTFSAMASDFTNSADNLTGRLLISSPTLGDSEFARSVVYVCAHSATDGAMGLIINKRAPHPTLETLLEQLEITPSPPRRRINLCMGGPVEPTRGFVLHSADWQRDDSLVINNENCLTASLDILHEIANGKGPRQALLALGHASWEAGQLENEIIRQNAWLNAPASDDLIYGTNHMAKWRKALAAINIDPLLLSNLVGHA
ncbi:YqgE/AlgH family protein [Asaia sp. HN010]|uniref:YqgE/AlgH family protein n=1 Tax=Asaia sp. HN010 TaxID=3081233 RepID=UPI0038D2021D